jgi:uncharacterized protein (TIGR02266 family)
VTTDRRDSRLPVKLEVAFRTQGAFLIAYSVNLSKGGVFLETQDLLEVGTEVTLRLAVPGAGEFELIGAVAWVRQASPDGLPDGMGIQIRDLDERYGEAIDEMVQQFMGISVLVLAAAQERLTQLGRYVRSIMSCEIFEATSAEEADQALTAAPDLVVLELQRSTAFGLNTIERIKELHAGTPVILLAEDLRTRELGKMSGADEVLETPPSFAALQAAVIRTLSRPARVGP